MPGVLPLEGLGPSMAQLARTLKPSRTPNIIRSALERLAVEDQAKEAQAAETIGVAGTVEEAARTAEEAEEELFTIIRHGRTETVPWRWLTVALAFRGSPAAAPR